MKDVSEYARRLEGDLMRAEKALRDIIAHHEYLNARVGRPPERSHTIALARRGLGEV